MLRSLKKLEIFAIKKKKEWGRNISFPRVRYSENSDKGAILNINWNIYI
jgi:hypothetical protein